MRGFLYRISYDGFIDWLHDYNKVRRIIIGWEGSGSGQYKMIIKKDIVKLLNGIRIIYAI